MSIRKVLGSNFNTSKFIHHNTQSYITTRNIYLHTGKRVSGLKRDSEETSKTSLGYKYGLEQNNIKHLKEFLPAKYSLSDDLLLQVITHKSFNNGIKPYNEKLSAMGSKLLNLYCAKRVIDTPNTNNETAINGKNFDTLGSPIAKELSGRYSAGIFARTSRLNSIMFWKSYNHDLSFESSGEMKVSAQMIYALIGAITFIHGKRIAEEFIKEKLFSSQPSLEEITAKLIEQNDQQS